MFFWGLLKPHNIDSLNNSTMSFVAATMLEYIIGARITATVGTQPSQNESFSQPDFEG